MAFRSAPVRAFAAPVRRQGYPRKFPEPARGHGKRGQLSAQNARVRRLSGSKTREAQGAPEGESRDKPRKAAAKETRIEALRSKCRGICPQHGGDKSPARENAKMWAFGVGPLLSHTIHRVVVGR